MKRILCAIFLFLAFGRVNAQTINKQLVLQLDSILEADQRYRKIKNVNDEQDKENMRKQGALDLENLAKVEKLISRYGYPGKSMVGELHQSTAFLVIQHNDTRVQEKYLPLLTAAVESGEFRATSLAIMIDRIKTGNGLLQVYGSQLMETADGVKIQMIEDETNVNSRRKKIGLPPLEEYLKEWKINYHVPTADKPNPATMYYDQGKRELSKIEAIGGDAAIFAKLTYPEQAKLAGISGFVIVELTIGTDGITKNIMVIKPLGYGCDEVAVLVMKNTKYNNPTGAESEIRMKLPFPYKK